MSTARNDGMREVYLVKVLRATMIRTGKTWLAGQDPENEQSSYYVWTCPVVAGLWLKFMEKYGPSSVLYHLEEIELNELPPKEYINP